MSVRRRRPPGLIAAVLVGLAPVTALGLGPRPQVIELYTSEGCSSCPPADAYLARIADRKDVLAIAFHVDYWDSLGWRDRFALPEAVHRQERYARNLGRSSVYTPQWVVNGVTDGVPGRLPTAPVGATPLQAADLRIRRSGEVFDIEVGPGARPARSCDVLLVSIAARAQSVISRGENAGRSLQHANLVRSLQVLGSWSGEAREFAVPRASLPSDATDLAVLVQLDGQREIIAGARAALSSLQSSGGTP